MGFWFRDLLISQSAPAEISSARLACTRAQALQSPGRGSEVGTLKQSKRLELIPWFQHIPVGLSIPSRDGTFEKNETTNQKVNENSILSRLYSSEFGVPKFGSNSWWSNASTISNTSISSACRCTVWDGKDGKDGKGHPNLSTYSDLQNPTVFSDPKWGQNS